MPYESGSYSAGYHQTVSSDSLGRFLLEIARTYETRKVPEGLEAIFSRESRSYETRPKVRHLRVGPLTRVGLSNKSYNNNSI